MTEFELDKLGESVKSQRQNGGSALTDLVFDPTTGEFKQVPKGTQSGPGDVVTEMTEKGFA